MIETKWVRGVFIAKIVFKDTCLSVPDEKWETYSFSRVGISGYFLYIQWSDTRTVAFVFR